jgi:hypothetical protein
MRWSSSSRLSLKFEGQSCYERLMLVQHLAIEVNVVPNVMSRCPLPSIAHSMALNTSLMKSVVSDRGDAGVG